MSCTVTPPEPLMSASGQLVKYAGEEVEDVLHRDAARLVEVRQAARRRVVDADDIAHRARAGEGRVRARAVAAAVVAAVLPRQHAPVAGGARIRVAGRSAGPSAAAGAALGKAADGAQAAHAARAGRAGLGVAAVDRDREQAQIAADAALGVGDAERPRSRQRDAAEARGARRGSGSPACRCRRSACSARRTRTFRSERSGDSRECSASRHPGR